jgi:vacuolar-type H+-ATPase subunit H
MIMVEDVLAVVRKTEDEAEKIINSAKTKGAKILDKADEDSRRIILELEKKGKTQSEKTIEKARVEGGKEGKEIIEAEEKKAAKLESASEKNLEKGVSILVDSVIRVGGS